MQQQNSGIRKLKQLFPFGYAGDERVVQAFRSRVPTFHTMAALQTNQKLYDVVLVVELQQGGEWSSLPAQEYGLEFLTPPRAQREAKTPRLSATGIPLYSNKILSRLPSPNSASQT